MVVRAMQQSDILSLAHLRLDGRRGEEQRRVRYKAGLPAGAAGLCRGADGWSYLESGLNRVLVGVQGPREGPRGVMDKVRVLVTTVTFHYLFSMIYNIVANVIC